MAREKAALQSSYQDTRARDLQEGSGGSSKYWPPALALGAPAGQGGLRQSRPKRPSGSSQWAPARKAHTPGLRCPQQVTWFCHCWGRPASWGRPRGPPLESSQNPPKGHNLAHCHQDSPEELGPLGQCLQPGHTLAPMAVQGGDHPPCLQAPDVHQPAQGPVQTSTSQARAWWGAGWTPRSQWVRCSSQQLPAQGTALNTQPGDTCSSYREDGRALGSFFSGEAGRPPLTVPAAWHL